ncbi:MAG: hypothetical protein ACUVV3_06600 [Dehalococcoidia bacterium]
MNVIRCTVVDERGAVSFIVHADALSALTAACSANPSSLEELLEGAEPYYRNLREQVLNGLALFEERNVEGNYQVIHQALRFRAPHEHPVFRVVDDFTRETSLRPVKAGAVIFNLRAKRIIQIINTYQEIQRTGRGRVFDGSGLTDTVYSYRLPQDWALVP